MQKLIGLLLILILLGSTLTLCVSCGDANNPSGAGSSTSTPVPTPIALYKNGAFFYWFGNSLYPSGSTTDGNVSVADNLTGDTTTYKVANTSSSNTLYCSISCSVNGGENTTAYFASGHLQFDVEYALAPGNYSSLFVIGYGASPVTVQLTPSSYSNTAFTAVSVPFTSLYPSTPSSVQTPFTIEGNLASYLSGPLLYFNNVHWTAD